jgi:TPR repeat protein
VNATSSLHFRHLRAGDYTEVLRVALPRATTGNSDAQCMISLLEQCGFGVRKDLAEAEPWLLKADKQDRLLAWNNLGSLWAMGGTGLPGGPERA